MRFTRAGQSYHALGRLKPGEMNKTEAAYSQYLEQLKTVGDILWFKFEGVKLRLASNCFLTVDFFVLRADGTMEGHEVKGYMTDDALVKLKVVAETYPFIFRLVRKEKSGWKITEI